ncbi:MAG: iron ABC transporter permease [Treponema sp.]|nr:iron ABC transporter permease [Treponema sp.]
MKTTRRFTFTFLFFSLLLVFSALLSLCVGNIQLPLSHIFKILMGIERGEAFSVQEVNIIMKIRLPRLIMAFILGGSLSLSGFLLQTYFQNPIAGPFVLGISSGAKMTVAALMIFSLNLGHSLSSFGLVAAAFLGALISTFFILLVARRVRHIGALLVAGIMIGYISSAITDFFITFAEDAQIANLHGWSKGSFAGFDMSDCAFCAVVIFLTVLAVFFLSKPIGAYQLGETYARTMGVNTKIFRPILILLSSLLSATVTAFAGPISFVGIAVPFLAKRFFLTSRPIVIIPASFMLGSIFCILCDLLARTIFSPLELSISTVTSVFGAPIVIFMILTKRR